MKFEALCREKSLQVEIKDIRSGRWEDISLSEASIEQVARQLQNVLWSYRDHIWNDVPDNQLEVLKPEIAIEKLLGYKFGYTILGQHTFEESISEIAGQIDKVQRTILVSSRFQRDVQNFTAAHELGHALFHKGIVLHRDIPLDGSTPSQDIRERQANKFAAFFLMPEKQVKKVFQDLFLTQKFVINQNTVFELREESVSNFRNKCRNSYGLARFLAGAESFKGKSFNSISKVFSVSIGAMANRLIELDLVEF